MIVADLTVFFPWQFFKHLVEALFIYNIVHSMLKDKFNSVLTCTIYSVATLVYSFISVNVLYNGTPISDLLILVGYIAVLLVLTFTLTEGKVFTKILSIVFGQMFWLLSTVVFTVLAHASALLRMSLGLYSAFLGLMVCSSFVWTGAIRLIMSKIKKHENYGSRLLIYFVYPISHAVIFMFLTSMLSFQNQEAISSINQINTFEILLCVFAAVCILADMVLIFIIDHNQETEERMLNSERELMKSQMDYEQIQLLNKEKSEFRKLKHDMMNITTTLRGFCELGNVEKALEILDGIDSNVTGFAGFNICSNETLNTALYIKTKLASEKQVKLDIEIDELSPIKTESYDLCRLVHNLCDNAINAASECEEKAVTLRISSTPELVKISTINPFKLEDKKKKSSPNHGFGTKIMKEIAKRYEGEYTRTFEGEVCAVCVKLTNAKLTKEK